MEQLKKAVLTVTLMVGGQISTLAGSLEQNKKEVGELRKKRNAAIQELCELRESKGRTEYKPDRLQARLQRGQHECEKCANTFNRVQSGIGELQKLVKKASADLERHVEEHWVKRCQYLSTLLTERVVKVLKDQIRDASKVAGLFVQSWKNCLKRMMQLVQEPLRVGDASVEKLGPGYGDDGETHTALTGLGDVGYDTDAGRSSA